MPYKSKATRYPSVACACLAPSYFDCGGLLLSAGGAVFGDVVSGGFVVPGVVEFGLLP
jgi:hypothetical protein